MDGFTCQDLIDIARKFAPIMRFDRRESGQEESFFPVNVESWLAHVAAFNEANPRCPQRGTSLWTYPWLGPNCPDVGAGSVEWLPPAGPAMANFIGNPEFTSNPKHFLNFGSWLPWDATNPDFLARVRGNRDYAFQVYDVVRPITRGPGEVPVQPQSPPQMRNGVQPQLTCYCEVALGDRLAELAFSSAGPESSETFDSDDAVRKLLADYVVFTYYYFYPCMEPFKPSKFMEGQWEAISVIFKMYGSKYEMQPRFVAYSQSYRLNNNNWFVPRAEAASWTALGTPLLRDTADPNHPLAYVAWGTHGNFFSPQYSPIEPNPPDVATSIGAGIFVAGAATMLVGMITGNPYVIIAGLIIAVIGWLIMLFAALCGDDDDEASEGPTYLPESNPQVEQHHNGQGAAVLPPGAVPVGFPPGPSQMVLRLIDPSDAAAVQDSNPKLDGNGQPTECEHPYWWRYVGRFGVFVDLDVGASTPTGTQSTWAHGSRRIDERGVSGAVVNMRAVLQLITDPGKAGAEYDL